MRIILSKLLTESLRDKLPPGYDLEEAVAAILSAFVSGKFIPSSEIEQMLTIESTTNPPSSTRVVILKSPNKSGISVEDTVSLLMTDNFC